MSTLEIVDVAPADMQQFVVTAEGFWGEVPEPGLDLVHRVLDRAFLARLDEAALREAAADAATRTTRD